MSTLRKLKRKEAAPKIKQAKKIASEYMAKEKIAHNATLAQSSKINKQAVVRINTCVFKVLREIFKMSRKKIAYLSNQIDFQVSCLKTKQPGTKETYLTYEMILDALPAETGWTFPAYELKGKDRLEMTAAEMADYDAQKFLNEAKAKMELLWLWTLRIREGFSKVRLDRFSKALREAEKKLTTAEAENVKDWLTSHGIEFTGFDKKYYNQVEYYAG